MQQNCCFPFDKEGTCGCTLEKCSECIFDSHYLSYYTFGIIDFITIVVLITVAVLAFLDKQIKDFYVSQKEKNYDVLDN